MSNKKIISYLIFFTILLLILEIPSYFICKKLFIARGLVYDAPKINRDAYNNYIKYRDLNLGWKYAKGHEVELDKSGSRIIPFFPNPESNPACMSVYGDSYTFSNRTTPEEAWSNKLSILLNCRVANFGVSGYGSDQAYMRFLANRNDTAKIVMLNHFVDDISRNVNQHWGVRFTDLRHAFNFKPRFVLKGNNLEKVPTPDFTYEEILELQEKPEKYLKHEFFLPNGDYGSVYLHFPYTFVLTKTIFTHSKFRSLIKGEPIHAPYYKRDHPSQSLQLTTEILAAFTKEAKSQNRFPIVNIIPFDQDLDYYNETGKWCYQNLIDDLAKKNIEVLNLGELMIDALKGKDHTYLYAGEGHFNANGDSLMAQLIFTYLQNKNFH